MTTLYGISNCATMKKAMNWLDEHGVAYTLHDYKKSGIDTDTVEQWLANAGRDTLVNRRGMTWRNLSEAEKEICRTGSDADVAVLLVERPTLIKRPVVPTKNRFLVGFDATAWTDILSD